MIFNKGFGISFAKYLKVDIAVVYPYYPHHSFGLVNGDDVQPYGLSHNFTFFFKSFS